MCLEDGTSFFVRNLLSFYSVLTVVRCAEEAISVVPWDAITLQASFMTSRGCASPYGILENSLAAGPAVIRQVSQGSDLVEQDEAALPGTPGPSIDTPATPPLSPMRPIIPDLKGQYQPHVSLPCPHVLSPSEGAGVDGQSARANPARVSPSHWFLVSPDQIDALGMLRTWIHSQVC